MELERVVILEYKGERFVFRPERGEKLTFWAVEWNGEKRRTHYVVYGNEDPALFRQMADEWLRRRR